MVLGRGLFIQVKMCYVLLLIIVLDKSSCFHPFPVFLPAERGASYITSVVSCFIISILYKGMMKEKNQNSMLYYHSTTSICVGTERCHEFEFPCFVSHRFCRACLPMCLKTLLKPSGLLDNVLSDYLWAKAILLTSTTVATAGLTIQVPLAAIVDSLTGNAPNLMDYIGAAAVMVGFAGINVPVDDFCRSKARIELEEENMSSGEGNAASIHRDTAIS